MKSYEKVTVFVSGGFGFHGTECKTLSIEEGPYAQHQHAHHVRFLEPRCRNARGFVQCGINAHFVVLSGHGHVNGGKGRLSNRLKAAPSPLTEEVIETTSDGLTVATSASCFCSFDPAYTAEFYEALAAYCAATGATVLFDSRTSEAKAA